MKEAQKKFLGAALAVSSIAGIVAPSVTAMATVIEDEENATPEQLKSVINEYSVKLEKDPIFANYHRVSYAAQRLAQYDEQYANNTLNSISKYDSKVYTKDIVKLVDKMNDFSISKEMKIYDELVNEDIPSFAKTDKESADYLLGRLDVWGKAIVFEVDKNYSNATDEIVKVNTLREKDKLEEALDQVDVAKKAIKNIVTYDINGKYLEGKLKLEEDKVRHDIQERDLYVREVSAKNGKEIEVKFNKEVSKDSAENEENYEFKGANSDAVTSELKAQSAELQDDNKTVIVKLVDKDGEDDKGTPLNNKTNAKYLVTIKDVLDRNDEEIKEFSEIVSLFDNDKPEVSGLEYRDNTIRINFSEPVKLTEESIGQALKIKLDGKKITIPKSAYNQNIDDDGMYFEIERNELDIEDDKTYSLELDGLVDYSSNAMDKYTKKISVEKDDTKPTIEKVQSLSDNAFKVVFSEKVKRNTIKVQVKDGDDIYTNDKDITGKNVYKDIKIEDEDKDDADEKIFIVRLPEGKTIDGNVLVTIYSFEDKANTPNVGKSVTKEMNFEKGHPILETEAPEYKTIENKKYAVFTFDRDVLVGDTNFVEAKYVDTDGVTHTENPKMYGSDEVEGCESEKSLSGDKLEKNEIAICIDNLPEGDYTFDFEKLNIKDTYNQDIEKISLDFTRSGKNAVKNDVIGVKQLKDDNDKVVITFKKALTKQGIKDAGKLSNYEINSTQVFEKAEVKESKDSKVGKYEVELTLKSGAIKTTGQKTISVENIDGVKNFNENTIDNKEIILNENVRPEISKVEAISYTTINLTMSEEIKNHNGENKDLFEVTVNSRTAEISSVTGWGTDTLTITLTNEDKLQSEKDVVKLAIKESDDMYIADQYINKADKQETEVEVNFQQLLVKAYTAVNDLVEKSNNLKDKNGNIDKEKLESACSAIKPAEDAVAILDDNSIDKTNLEAQIKDAKNRINLAENIQDATNYVEALETACKQDLTVEANLTAAKNARESAQKSVDDLEKSEDKTKLQNRINNESKKIDEQDKNNKAKVDAAIEKINTNGATVEEFKTAGINGVSKDNLESVKNTIEAHKKDLKETKLDATAIQKDVDDTNDVIKEATRYITTAKIDKTAKMDTDIDSIIVKLNDDKAVTGGIKLTKHANEKPVYINVEGEEFKLIKENKDTDKATEIVSFDLTKLYAKSTVEVTVTIEKSAETPAPAPTTEP